MLFVSDENFPMRSTLALRHAGFDVLSIKESFEGIEDPLVLDIARLIIHDDPMDEFS
jgi:hypothetical protein